MVDVTSALFGGLTGGLFAGIGSYIGFNSKLITQGIKLQVIEDETRRLINNSEWKDLYDLYSGMKGRSNDLHNKLNSLEENIVIYNDNINAFKTDENYNRIQDILKKLKDQSINFDHLEKLIEISFKSREEINVQSKLSNC